MLQKPDIQTKALLDLADFMETLDPKLYKQEIFNDGCGRGCIAHWACMLGNHEFHFSYASEALGLSKEQADKLFNPDAGQVYMMGCLMRGPRPKDAAKAIRHLAVTGEVPLSW